MMTNWKSAFRLLLLLIGLLVMGIVLADCGGGGGTSGSSGGAASTVVAVSCPASGTADNSIAGMAFNPVNMTVAVNDVVKWTNNDGVTHTVTSTTVPANGTFNLTVNPGASVCLKFTSAGTFNYHCSIHPSMVGSITVP